MRLALRSGVVALVVASLIATPLYSAPSRALGVVLQAERARLSTGDAAAGASVYDGDRLLTDVRGLLRLRLGSAQLYMLENSGVSLRQTPAGAGAVLQQGTVIWSIPAGDAFELRASDAVIRGKVGQSTVGQVTLLSPNTFVVTCTRGELAVTIDEETRAVPEGNSYRVEPEAQSSGGNGRPPHRAGRSKFIWLPLFAVGGITAYFVARSLVSPAQ